MVKNKKITMEVSGEATRFSDGWRNYNAKHKWWKLKSKRILILKIKNDRFTLANGARGWLTMEK